MSMFCFQCQETAKGTGCTIKGVCGKTDDLAQLMDTLMFTVKGISVFSTKAREKGIENDEVNKFVFDSLFTTITNANFDKSVFIPRIMKGIELRDLMQKKVADAGLSFSKPLPEAATWQPKSDVDIINKAPHVGVLSTKDDNIRSLREMLIYGLKGMAAYGEHAHNLGFEDKTIWAFMQKGLAATVNDDLTMNDYLDLIMECGKNGVAVMALLDKANSTTYGKPEITKVNIGVRNKPGILISGHDLRDLEDLLEQTKGTGVDVYTHSEMLPAHYYPYFKKYDNFIGNYGGSWWHQREDFEPFNGPILFTTNCIVPIPVNAGYKDKVYTTGAAGFESCYHFPARPQGGRKDFSKIIEHAKKCPPPTQIETGEIIGGFAHDQVAALADKVVDAVKSGAIKKFVVMGGCDGRMKSREYYTEFATKLPHDTVILTAGCAKYRYNKAKLGDIGGIPRVLDAGQCNDSYSLAVTALKLKEIFGLDDINKLPIVYNIAWYEQKAVIVFISLLYLGVKNIHLGPTMPGFLSPDVAKILIEKFKVGIITTADEDLKKFLN